MYQERETRARQMLTRLRTTLDDIRVALNIKGVNKERALEEYFLPLKKEFDLTDIIYDEKTLRLHFNTKIRHSYKAVTEIQKFLTQKERERGKVEVKEGEYFKISISKGEVKAYTNYLEIKRDLISDPNLHETLAFVIDELGYLSQSQ